MQYNHGGDLRLMSLKELSALQKSHIEGHFPIANNRGGTYENRHVRRLTEIASEIERYSAFLEV